MPSIPIVSRSRSSTSRRRRSSCRSTARRSTRSTSTASRPTMRRPWRQPLARRRPAWTATTSWSRTFVDGEGNGVCSADAHGALRRRPGARGDRTSEASKLVADGRTHPVIALRMIDKYGKPARPGTHGYVQRAMRRIDPGGKSSSSNDNQILASRLARADRSKCRCRTAWRCVELEPTTHDRQRDAAPALQRAPEQEIRVWLAPPRATGSWSASPRGTAAYNTITGNMEIGGAADLEEGYTNDGRVAFFAKGAIKGEFLLTAAYDSARDHEVAQGQTARHDRAGSLLHALWRRDRAALRSVDVASKLYREDRAPPVRGAVRRLRDRLDADRAHALQPQSHRPASPTSRASASVTALRGRPSTGYVQDELQGDGTSGLYHLSRAPIVIGSDKIRIEVRDRFEITRVVESRRAVAASSITASTTERGTVFFKQPVPSRDAELESGLHRRRLRSAHRR